MRDRFSDISIETKKEHFDKLIAYREGLKQHPDLKSLFIEMTIQCNQHCRHCGSNCGDVKPEQGLTDYEILQCLIKLRSDCIKAKRKLPFLNITGGEPLLRPHLPELMKTIRMLGYQWGMTSNGTLIDEAMARALKDAGMYSIGLSLDGLEDTHNWFRQSKDGFAKSIQAFKNLQKAGQEQILVTTVVHKRNLQELEDIYQYLKALGCKNWRVINVEPIGRARDNAEVMLDGEGYKQMMDFIVTHQDDPDMQVIYSCNHYLGLDVERKVRPWYYMCRAGLSVASIQYNGDISACLDIERRPDLIFGNIRQDDFDQVWQNEFEIYRKPRVNIDPRCKNCEDMDRCLGGGWHTWDFEHQKPIICMMHEIG